RRHTIFDCDWSSDVCSSDLGRNITYYQNDGTGLYDPPAGFHDTLVVNANGTITYTTVHQIVYQFNSSGYLTSISDRNSNAVSFSYNVSNYCTGFTDATGRSVALTLNGSNQLTAISDPMSHVWSLTHNGSDDISTISWPAIGGITYADQFTNNAGHQILTHVDRRAKTWSAGYYASGRLTGETDPLHHHYDWVYTLTNADRPDPSIST